MQPDLTPSDFELFSFTIRKGTGYTRGDPVNRRDPNGTCDEDTATSVNVCDTYSLLDLDPVISWPGNGYISGSEVADQITGAQSAANQMVAAAPYTQALAAFQMAATYIASEQGDLNSPACAGDLAAVGTNAAAIQEAAGYAVFQNGVGNSTTLANTYAGGVGLVPSNAPPGTVGSFISGNPLGIVAVADLGGNNIYLNGPLISGLLNNTLKQTSGTFSVTADLLHELLHNVTGLTDPDLQRDLIISDTAPSDNISQRLLTDCLPPGVI